MLREVHASSAAQFKHDDSMLIWTMGLMGAGVFYASNLLSSVPAGPRFIALAPWILGILASLAARVIGGRRLQGETTWYIREMADLRAAVLASKDLPSRLLAVVEVLFRFMDTALSVPGGIYLWWLRLSLAAHVLAGTGVVTVVAAAFLVERSAIAAMIAMVRCRWGSRGLRTQSLDDDEQHHGCAGGGTSVYERQVRRWRGDLAGEKLMARRGDGVYRRLERLGEGQRMMATPRRFDRPGLLLWLNTTVKIRACLLAERRVAREEMTVRPEDTLRAAGISTKRQAKYQRRMSSLLAGNTRGERR
jgi:hypothetical protein